MRTICESFIVARPGGTSIRTRLRLTPTEADALRAIGGHNGSLYRKDLAKRIAIGKVPAKENGRAERKKALTEASSSRWAGAMTRASNDQYRFSLDGAYRYCSTLQSRINTIESRIKLPTEDTLTDEYKKENPKRRKGYSTQEERYLKQTRLDHAKVKLQEVDARITDGHPSIVMGGQDLLHKRHNLEAAGITLEQWRAEWDTSRRFLTADGESKKRYGNETIRISPEGECTIKVPRVLADNLGKHLALQSPIRFNHRGEDWLQRVKADCCIRYDIREEPSSGKWFINASWGLEQEEPPSLSDLKGSVVAIDVNGDHLAAWAMDGDGNPLGHPRTYTLELDGLSASHRDGLLREAISRILDYAAEIEAVAIVIEDLNFQDAREQGREQFGNGRKSKRFRKTVAGIPTTKFRDRLVAMAATRDMWVIAVDPAYTSKWAAQHWQKPLSETIRISSSPNASRPTQSLQTSPETSNTGLTRHQAAALVIGRRAFGYTAKRRNATSLGAPEDAPAVTMCSTVELCPKSQDRTMKTGSASTLEREPVRRETVGRSSPTQDPVTVGGSKGTLPSVTTL